ncbi:MAG: hypothetical protein HKM89_02285 [Gemmatimonadales bacterium]|nr:hypothetical protein [Gemmatimonadales bacterium]
MMLSLAAGIIVSACAAGTPKSVIGPDPTSPGTTATLRENIDDVERRVRFAFTAMEIAPFGSPRTRVPGSYAKRVQNEPPVGRVIEGRKGDLDVIVKIEPKTNSTTRLDIRVRRNPTDYDSDFERQLLERIRGT